ncbi:DUF3299 domain-containing protein [uncultured Nitratireductor sp.]|uniref:DUF3299 domain-containing protein n=1 Tax=uncultured Nitratireductor sp. TaxID=520953 RepID=UPI0025F7A869|nr:DUF3299 domain-containing protein [uncultured Nitratireductor sp.]
MTGRFRAFYAVALSALAGPTIIELADATPIEPRQIEWAELAPDDRTDAKTPVSLATQLGGRPITLSGYLLPADREDELVYAFMLVARRGACSHMRQPPANQVIRVVPSEPYRLSSNYEPVTVTGTLLPGLEKTQLFILDGAAIIESGYTVRRAEVRRNKTVPEWRTPSSDNPWHRVTKGAELSAQPPLDPPASLSSTR